MEEATILMLQSEMVNQLGDSSMHFIHTRIELF